MQLEVGKVLDGKVTGITKFGAFVELESGEVGMVHISEVSSTYVNDISEHLQEGQQVKVKVMSFSDDGKIALSIKKAQAPVARNDNRDRPNFKDNRRNNFQKNKPQRSTNTSRNINGKTNSGNSKPAQNTNSFEDMLSKFMQSSDEKISDIKRTKEHSRKAAGFKRK